MKLALFETRATLDSPQRALLDLARGLLARHWELIVILGADGPLADLLRQMAVPVIIEPLAAPLAAMPSLWQPAVWRYAWRLAVHLRRDEVRLLYAHTPVAAALGGLALWGGGRVIWRVHQPLEAPPAPLGRFGAHLLWQVHVPCPAVRETLTLLGHGGSAIHVIPYGIAVPSAARPSRKRTDPPVIGMLGSWAPPHGQEVLGRAFRLLQEHGQRAHLRFAGRAATAEQQRLRATVISGIAAAGWGDRVTVEDAVADVSAFFAGCDVVVIPALQDASVRKALEAAALGRPVVASRVSGMAEVVKDGHTGLLVPPNAPRALADALALLLASPALRAEMGRQARVRVEERYSLDAMLDAVEAAIMPRAA